MFVLLESENMELPQDVYAINSSIHKHLSYTQARIHKQLQGAEPTSDSVAFFFDVLPANQQASTQVVVLPNLLQLIEYLQGQFSGGRDDQGTQSIQ